MRVTKFGHACVRIEYGGSSLVIDPGVFTEPDAVDGVDAIVITHEHPDHVSPELLARSDAPIHTIAAVAAQLPPEQQERTRVLIPGQQLLVAGAEVTVVGQMHAVIHPDYPRSYNSGYVVHMGGQRLYHPGDALTPPPVEVDICCVPVSGPWLKVSEAIDFARSVKAPVNLGIHDKAASAIGLGMVANHMGNLLGQGQRFVLPADGDDLTD